MANAFSGQSIAAVALSVRDHQSGKRTLSGGILAQLQEYCATITAGKDLGSYLASVTDPDHRMSAPSDWMAVQMFAKQHKK
ncbi:MAG: hypothetical protein H0V44_18535 [Planctomycetes bacterium]|nr:hypothetical protein [Planctomycetota bacterium]